ncbi:helix-turn-helix transcriptional regulator [Micromonospora sp. WMMD1102]|uniref:helix-turn-helix transcriptional regulator n=1 Tax=Micromonospora sp. WMMD1102 TaxID=3016105 RepID=UPI003242AD6A
MLDALGLSTRDEAVYTAMLAHPQLGIARLAEHLSTTDDDVRAALENLADLALVRTDPAGGLRAARPQAGLLPLLMRAEAEIVARQHQIAATRDAITSIATTYQAADAQEAVNRLDGIEAVRERLAELAGSVRFECVSFSPGGAQSDATISAEAPLNQQALERGVTIRNLYLESFRNDSATLAHARAMAAIGSQSRTVPALPMRMVIVDRRLALVPSDPDDPSAGALEIETPALVLALYSLFEQMWHTATPFGDAPVPDLDGITGQERELLRLLGAGQTDEAVARTLALSVRSVQRMMASITDRLEASSRFQAGVESCRRGWV